MKHKHLRLANTTLTSEPTPEDPPLHQVAPKIIEPQRSNNNNVKTSPQSKILLSKTKT